MSAVSSRPKYWLVANALVFVFVETAGYVYLGDTPVAATAFFHLLFSIVFFGFFSAFYAGSVYVIAQNPWLRDVRDMKVFGAGNYMAWLFLQDEEEWFVYTTIIGVLVTVLFGTPLFLLFADGHINTPNSYIGFCAACLLLGLSVWSFWEGYWKPKCARMEHEHQTG